MRFRSRFSFGLFFSYGYRFIYWKGCFSSSFLYFTLTYSKASCTDAHDSQHANITLGDSQSPFVIRLFLLSSPLATTDLLFVAVFLSFFKMPCNYTGLTFWAWLLLVSTLPLKHKCIQIVAPIVVHPFCYFDFPVVHCWYIRKQ